MKNKITAFSLAEVLVTLSIVGLIATLIIPAIQGMQPDRNKMLFKKAYTNVERVVTELVNDAYMYPEASGFDGLDNTTETKLNDTTYSGGTKFCRLFAMKLNTIDANTINCPHGTFTDGNVGVPSFMTNDGIAFFIPSTSFATAANIGIDVNGENPPNCKYSNRCQQPDRFEVFVAADGGISVTGKFERAYLKSSSVVRE